MKFYGLPNQLVKTKKRKPFTMIVREVPLFRFDINGEYETDDAELIKKLVLKFRHDEIEKISKESNAPGDKPSEEKVYQCKKCNFTASNMGLLMAHYREHKKEG